MSAVAFATQPSCVPQSFASSRGTWARQPAAGPSAFGRQRPRRALPPAACAARAGNSAAQPRHFLRPSLLATGLTEPQDVLQHCLALFRKADLAALQQYLPDGHGSAVHTTDSTSTSSGSGSRPALPVGPLHVVEEGPLASLAGVLDVGARRVLPGHLLRRSQVAPPPIRFLAATLPACHSACCSPRAALRAACIRA
jgi:hypothetical protein